MATIAYKYGALWPKDWGPDCERQLQLQVELWNALVRIYNETKAEIRALTPNTEELDIATKALDTFRVDAQATEMRIKAARSGILNSEESIDPQQIRNDRLHLAEVRRSIKIATQDRLGLARSARAAYASEQVATAIDRQQQHFKEARQKAASSGLWWSNYNAIMASFDVARQRRAKDGGGDLKEKRFHGDGRLTVQLQGGATIDEIFASPEDGGRSEARLIMAPPPGWENCRAGKTPPTPGSKRSNRRSLATLALTVYTSRNEDGKVIRRFINIPIVYDRPLPSDARIQQIVMTRRRGNRSPTGDWRYEVVFTLRVADPVMRPSERLAAIHIGWRKVADGIRVATVADCRGCSYFVLPLSINNRFERASSMLSLADTSAKEMQHIIKSQFHINESSPSLIINDIELVNIAHSGSSAAMRLRGMLRNWLEHCPDYYQELRDVLSAWSHKDVTLRWMARNIVSRAVRHRRDVVRVWVAGLVANYDTVIIQQNNIAKLKRRGKTTDLEMGERRCIQRMAPGDVRANVVMSLAKNGITVHSFTEDIPLTCSICGGLIAHQGDSTTMIRCSFCPAHQDIDENTARNYLAALVRQRRQESSS